MSLHRLTLTGTFWRKTGSNGVGGFTYGSPTPIKYRQEFRTQVVKSADGRDIVAKCVVYFDGKEQMLGAGDYFYAGVSAQSSPIAQEGADEIAAITAIEGLSNDRSFGTAWL